VGSEDGRLRRRVWVGKCDGTILVNEGPENDGVGFARNAVVMER
jgi:hypothetical protein